MKRMILMTACCALLLGCGKTEYKSEQTLTVVTANSAEPLTAGEGETVQAFDLGGMTCEGCQGTIFDALTDIPGVKRASVSLDEEKAWVLSDLNDAPSADTIVAAVKAKEYEATPVTP